MMGWKEAAFIFSEIPSSEKWYNLESLYEAKCPVVKDHKSWSSESKYQSKLY